MGDDGGGKKVDSQVQKQKDALAKAKSVVQRPSTPNTPPQSQNVINSNFTQVYHISGICSSTPTFK